MLVIGNFFKSTQKLTHTLEDEQELEIECDDIVEFTGSQMLRFLPRQDSLRLHVSQLRLGFMGSFGRTEPTYLLQAIPVLISKCDPVILEDPSGHLRLGFLK